MNKKIVATINHNEHKDGLLNNKGIRHSINRTQIKDHKDENIWNQQNFIVLLWWQNTYSKQWIWWISSWILELIIKKIMLIVFRKAFFSSMLF